MVNIFAHHPATTHNDDRQHQLRHQNSESGRNNNISKENYYYGFYPLPKRVLISTNQSCGELN